MAPFPFLSLFLSFLSFFFLPVLSITRSPSSPHPLGTTSAPFDRLQRHYCTHHFHRIHPRHHSFSSVPQSRQRSFGRPLPLSCLQLSLQVLLFLKCVHKETSSTTTTHTSKTCRHTRPYLWDLFLTPLASLAPAPQSPATQAVEAVWVIPAWRSRALFCST